MSRKAKWITVLTLAVLATVVHAGVMRYFERQDLARLERRISELEQERDTLIEKQSRLTERLASMRAAAEPTLPAPSAQATPAIPAAEKTERQFAYLKSVSPGKPGSLVADFAQFLTGKDATAAAKKAGAESPPPNDYFIVNENPKLRTLPVAANVEVTLTTKPGEGSVAEGYSSNVASLSAYLATDNEETASLRANGFWLHISGGVVVAIEEQYTP